MINGIPIEIVALAKKYGARIMVDDAHGLGVLGEHGRGTAEHFGHENEVDIYMGTFFEIACKSGRIYGGKQRCCRVCSPRFAPVYFQRKHNARFGGMCARRLKFCANNLGALGT